MKNKILFFLKLPPPITGATLMNKYVAESNLLKVSFNIKTIAVSYNKSVSKMGTIGIFKIFKIFGYSYKLIKQLFIFNPNLVYFQISPLGIAFLRDVIYITIIKLFRIRIVYHLRGKGINKQLANPIKKNIYKYVFRNEYIIALSKRLNYDIELVINSYIYNIPNGFPISELSLHKKRHDNFSILFLSNLIISKGIIDYLNSLVILKKKNIDFEGIIVGAESDFSKEQLKYFLEKNNLKNEVKYVGAKYGKAKYEILKTTDILVFPTKNDIWGNVNLEAMQFSIPIISTNEGAIPEIIDDGITGFIVDKNSPKQIAEKIEYLINNPEKRIEMGKAGRKKFLEKYTIDKFEENMRNVFNDIFNKLEKNKK